MHHAGDATTMIETRSAKRRRGESPEVVIDLEEGLQHSSEIWFQDGNVILRAESMLFRVHRGLLSAQSPVLQERLTSLFEPIPTGMTICHEGCPVLSLNDSSRDMTHFLKALMDRRYVFLSSYNNTDPKRLYA